MDFVTLFATRRWTPIRNCPGRFVLADGAVREPPATLVPDGAPCEYRVAVARDAVVVTSLSDGSGLISYERADGTFLHTLNTPEGFARKLAQLGIAHA